MDFIAGNNAVFGKRNHIIVQKEARYLHYSIFFLKANNQVICYREISIFLEELFRHSKELIIFFYGSSKGFCTERKKFSSYFYFAV